MSNFLLVQTEDQGLLALVLVEDFHHTLGFEAVVVHDFDNLGDVIVGLEDILAVNFTFLTDANDNTLRAHDVGGETIHLSGPGGTEAGGLAASLGHGLDDITHGDDKALVKHAVSFIEDEHLYRGQIEDALIAEILKTAGGGDNDIGTDVSDGLALLPFRNTADDADAGVGIRVLVSRAELGEFVDNSFDLLGELASGGEDYHAGLVAGLLESFELALGGTSEEGEEVAESLTGTGLGNGAHVLAVSQKRPGGGLDDTGSGELSQATLDQTLGESVALELVERFAGGEGLA